MIAPDWVSSMLSSSFLASPKSVTWGLPLLVQQDVRGLQIAVQDAPRMGVMHGVGHLGHQGRGGPRVVLVGVQPVGQAAAGNQLHAEVSLALVLANLIHRNDSGMVKLGHRLGLVLKPAELDIVRKHAGPDHLQRHLTVERDLASLVDDPHAASAQFVVDLVIAEIANAVAVLADRSRLHHRSVRRLRSTARPLDDRESSVVASAAVASASAASVGAGSAVARG